LGKRPLPLQTSKYEEALQIHYQVREKLSGRIIELDNQIAEIEHALANQNKSK